MKFTLKNTKEAALLSRKDISGSISFSGPVPNRSAVVDEIAKELKVKAELIAVQKIESKFGAEEADVIAHVYKTVEAFKANEPEHIVKRNKRKVEEAKPAKESDSTEKAKPAEESKPETPKNESKPVEETKPVEPAEEKPAEKPVKSDESPKQEKTEKPEAAEADEKPDKEPNKEAEKSKEKSPVESAEKSDSETKPAKE